MNSILALLLLLSLSTTSRGAEEVEPDKEFNIGFYYDAQAAQKVRYLGGMEMHARLCATQFNQAMMSAGINNIWVYPAMVAKLDYNAKGDMDQALARLSGDGESRLAEDMRKYELDFIVGFICAAPEPESLGLAYDFSYRAGVYDAQGDHVAEWRTFLAQCGVDEEELKGMHSEIIKIQVSDSEDDVYVRYAYRVLVTDLHSALNYYTFVHELGHLFGAGHSRYQNSSRGPANEAVTPYASGAYTTVESEGQKYSFATVMSYSSSFYTDDKISYVKLPLFSGPVYQTVGTLGEIVLGDEDNDNVRVIRETASILADHRPYLFKNHNTRLDAMREEYLRLILIMFMACLIVNGGVLAIATISFYLKAQDANNHKRKRPLRHDRIM